MTRTLDQIIEWRGKPSAIRSDNGPEYISSTVKDWAYKHAIELKYIQPGNPQQNAYIERFNRTMRYELLTPNLFASIGEVQQAATEWAYAHSVPASLFRQQSQTFYLTLLLRMGGLPEAGLKDRHTPTIIATRISRIANG